MFRLCKHLVQVLFTTNFLNGFLLIRTKSHPIDLKTIAKNHPSDSVLAAIHADRSLDN